jgi:large subunit ribosomal protein L7e
MLHGGIYFNFYYFRFVNKAQISNLITKRGHFYGNEGNIVPLDNNLIETSLGKYNIIVFEDMVHELYTCGEHFNDVMNFLGYFLLSPTEELKEKITISFSKGGSQGFRGNKINDLLKNMI